MAIIPDFESRNSPHRFPHQFVDHSVGQHVRIEGFLSLIKRGVMGSFHKVSRKYLPLYVEEFEFRYDNRLNENIFDVAIRHC